MCEPINENLNMDNLTEENKIESNKMDIKVESDIKDESNHNNDNNLKRKADENIDEIEDIPTKIQKIENGIESTTKVIEKDESENKIDKMVSENETKPPVPPPPLTAKILNIKSPEATRQSIRANRNCNPAAFLLKKPKLPTDMSNPAYKKPFKYGWRRELVYRANTDKAGKRNGDIYYFTPDGKKVRSMREVLENLRNKELSTENFTFYKEPVGMNNPELEIIRMAKVKGSVGSTGGFSMKKAKDQIEKVVIKPGKSPKFGSALKIKLSATRLSQTSKRSSKKKKSSKSNEFKSTVSSALLELRSVENNVIDGNENVDEKSAHSPATKRLIEQCSIRCNGVNPVVPTLQCALCLCLYHPECVAFDHHRFGNTNQQNYICKNCRPESDLSNLNLNNKTQIYGGNQLLATRLNRIDDTVSNKNSSNLHQFTDNQQPTIISGSGSGEAAAQSQAIIGGRKFIIIPKQNVLSVLTNNHKMAAEPPQNTIFNDLKPTTASYGPEVITVATNNASRNDVKEEWIKKPVEKIIETDENFLSRVSLGYSGLLHVFKYLKVKELLRVSRVCRMWYDLANHRQLWRTVRLKNSPVRSFTGLLHTLYRHQTEALDLRKIIQPNKTDEEWCEFSAGLNSLANHLRRIELARCPASVVQSLPDTNPQLELITAVGIRSTTIDLSNFSKLTNIRELRLKSQSGFDLNGDLNCLEHLTHLQQLSLLSFHNLGKNGIEIIGHLIQLECLELGECDCFPETFGTDILVKLVNLKRLRLEKGPNSSTYNILNAISELKQLEQIELVNFDVKNGFDEALAQCTNIKRLLLIPTYISQSATTNKMVLHGIFRLAANLTHFVWGVTLELLCVTKLFIDQCGDQAPKKLPQLTKNGNDSIPILKPVPFLVDNLDNSDNNSNKQAETAANSEGDAEDNTQVEILSLQSLQNLLSNKLHNTKVKILKVPYHATWRQRIQDSI